MLVGNTNNHNVIQKHNLGFDILPSLGFSVVSPINSIFLKVSSGNNSKGIRWPVKNPRLSGKSASICLR